MNRLRGNSLSIGQLLLVSGHAAGTAGAGAGTGSYKVMKGDTPHSIAQKHRMELADLLQMNRLTPRSTIFPGQTLLVQVQ